MRYSVLASRPSVALVHSLCTLAAALVTSMTVGSAEAASESNLVFRSAVTVDQPTVLLPEIADLAPLPDALRARAAELIVLELLPSVTTVIIDARRIAESARRQMPMLGAWLTHTRPQSIQITRRNGVKLEVAGTPAFSCVELLQHMDADTAPVPGQLRPVSCDKSTSPRAWRYDAATRVARASRPLASGEIVVAPVSQRMATVQRGDIVEQRTQVGAVTVVRSGTALADAAQNRSTTVQLGDGNTTMWLGTSHSRGQ